MKVKIFAVILMIILLTAVFINTFVIDKEIMKITDAVKKIEIRSDNTDECTVLAEDAFGLYQSREVFFSLTVNHDDLTSIEDNFAEMIGSLRVKDSDGASIVKNRLIHSLEHLKRLSGINIDAII